MAQNIEEVLQYCRDRLAAYIMLSERGLDHEKVCRILSLYDLKEAA